MENYIYKYLKIYGNTYLDNKTYRKMGKKRILDDLKEHGFECEIKIFKCPITDPTKKVINIEKDLIIELRK